VDYFLGELIKAVSCKDTKELQLTLNLDIAIVQPLNPSGCSAFQYKAYLGIYADPRQLLASAKVLKLVRDLSGAE